MSYQRQYHEIVAEQGRWAADRWHASNLREIDERKERERRQQIMASLPVVPVSERRPIPAPRVSPYDFGQRVRYQGIGGTIVQIHSDSMRISMDDRRQVTLNFDVYTLHPEVEL